MTPNVKSQQTLIREMFVKGLTRSQIKNKLGIRYQIVFKAVNVKYAPKSWSQLLTDAHAGKFVETKKRVKKSA